MSNLMSQQKIIDAIRSLRSELAEQNQLINAKLDKALEELKGKHTIIEKKIEYIERKQRKNNIVIFGLHPEDYKLETLVGSCSELFREKAKVSVDPSFINNIYALGTSSERPVVVELTTYIKKLEILKAAKNLKGSNIYISHDLTKSQQETRKTLREELKETRRTNPKAHIRQGKVVVNTELERSNSQSDTDSQINSIFSTPVNNAGL